MIGAVATAAAAALLALAPVRLKESSADGVLVRHSDGATSAARDLLEYAPRVRRDVVDQLGLALPREFVVDLALDRAELESRDGAGIEPWAAGVAFPREGRIAIRLDMETSNLLAWAKPYKDTNVDVVLIRATRIGRKGPERADATGDNPSANRISP